MSTSAPGSVAHEHVDYVGSCSWQKLQPCDVSAPQMPHRRSTPNGPPYLSGPELEFHSNSMTTWLRDASSDGMFMRCSLLLGTRSVDRSIADKAIPRARCRTHQEHLLQKPSNFLGLALHSKPRAPGNSSLVVHPSVDFKLTRCFSRTLFSVSGLLFEWHYQTLNDLRPFQSHHDDVHARPRSGDHGSGQQDQASPCRVRNGHSDPNPSRPRLAYSFLVRARTSHRSPHVH